MSDHTPADLGPAPLEARARHSRWSLVVWSVPLAALLIVAFLGLRAISDRGIDVVVTFEQAAGARVDDTKVIYLGAEAGRVTRIGVNDDGRRIDMTLRMDRRAERGLTSTTRFWLVGAKPTLNDLSSVKAAVSGLTIGVAPGVGGVPARHFDGLSEPPVVTPGTAGTGYVLASNDLGSARVGSPIYFHGQDIGRVTGVRFLAERAFQLDVFVFAPYDRMIRPGTSFWIASPLKVALTGKGATANVDHLSAVLSGALEIELPGDQPGEVPSPPGAEFILYPSQSDAESGPTGPEVLYAFLFKGAGGALSVGAEVQLLGFPIGVVESVRLTLDPVTGAPGTAAVAALWPLRLHVAAPGTGEPAGRSAADAAVGRLLALGYRAKLVQQPPLIGGRIIALELVAQAAPATLGPSLDRTNPPIDHRAMSHEGQARGIREFPSVDNTGGSLDDISGQVNQLLTKLNRVPIEAIGNDVRQAASSLNRIVSSPQLAESLQHLNQTLAQAEKMMTEVQPQLGPLLKKLDGAATELTTTVAAARGLMAGDGAGNDASLPDAIRQLNDAARSVRTLSDYLGRHPEALIHGRRDLAPEASDKDSR